MSANAECHIRTRTKLGGRSLRNRRFSRYFWIEVKGDPASSVKYVGSGREVRFLQAVGQIMTRIRPRRGYKYGLAFPASYRPLVMRRLHADLVKQLKLSLLFVDGRGRVEVLGWRDLRAALDKAKIARLDHPLRGQVERG